MRILARASSGYLRRRPWQLALLLLGIGTGVAVIVAVDLANNSARIAFELSMDAVNGPATQQIVGGPGGIDEALYTELRTVDGQQGLAPIVEGSIDVEARSLHLLGVDALADRDVRARSLRDAADPDEWAERLRQLLTVPGATLLTEAGAAALDLRPGQSFTVVANGTDVHAVLVGYLHDGPASGVLTDIAVTDIATAQNWLRMPGRLSRIDVHLDDDDQLRALRQRLPAGVQLLDTARRTRALQEMSRAFTTNLTAMSLLALLVGVFLIYNSVSFSVLQRRGLIGTLRALGLTRRQVIGLVLVESLLLGLLGAALGVLAGIRLGDALLALVAQSINDLYFRITVTDVAVNGWSIAKGFAAGLLATIVAAAVPAVEAARVSPRLAATRSALERRSSAALPWLAATGAVLLLGAVGLLSVVTHGLVVGLVALFLAILGAALLIPLAVRQLSRLLAPLAQRLAGSGAGLAIAGVAASLSRTGVAIVALAIAVATTIGVSVMVQSFRGSVADWLDHTLDADVYVAVAGGGALDPGLAKDLASAPGVVDWSSRRRAWLESDAGRTRLLAARMTARDFNGLELLDAAHDEIRSSFQDEGAVLVSEALAYRRGLRRGDTVYLETARGPRAFPVGATWRSYDSNPAAILMSRKIYDTFWNDRDIDSLGLYLADGADAAAVMARLQTTADGRQALMLRSNRDLRDLSLAIFDRTFIITNVLYWLAVAVAVIGILGALLALQLERAREFAIFRALGMLPAQLGRMVTLQSTFIGALCGLAAMPLGVLMAYLLIDVINRRAFGWSMQVRIDGEILWHGLLLSTAAALVAGLYPAWRAARGNPLVAMRED